MTELRRRMLEELQTSKLLTPYPARLYPLRGQLCQTF